MIDLIFPCLSAHRGRAIRCFLGAGVCLAGPVGAAVPDFFVVSEKQRMSVADAPPEFRLKSYRGDLMVSGDTAVFQASHVPGSDTYSSFHIHVHEEGAWTLQQRIDATDVSVNSEFGYAAAFDGETLVISAPAEPKGGIHEAGCLLVYKRTAGVWNLQAKLQADDAESGDYFGFRVALEGDTIVALAYGGVYVPGNNAAKAYFFHRKDGVWTLQGKLPTTPLARLTASYKHVAIQGDTVAVGVPNEGVGGMASAGRVYFFRRDEGIWSPDGTLVAEEAGTYDFFGTCVAMDESTLMIGAVESGASGGEGKVHVYRRGEAGAWEFEQLLVPANPEGIDPTLRFGATLCLEGDTVLVGGPGAGIHGRGSFGGSAYVFRRYDREWVRRKRLWPEADDNAGSAFGSAMDLFGEESMLIVGKEDIPGSASYDPNLDNRGVVLFLRLAESSGPEMRLIAAADQDESGTLKEDEWDSKLPVEKSTVGLFGLLDGDRSGELDFDELAAASRGSVLPSTYLRWLERLRIQGELDRNGDLGLSRDELALMWPPGQGKAVDAFLKRAKVPVPLETYFWLRLKAIPSLTKYEAAKQVRTMRAALAADLDQDGNGFITRLEFAALFKVGTPAAKVEQAWRAASGTPKQDSAPDQLAKAGFVEAAVLPKQAAKAAIRTSG